MVALTDLAYTPLDTDPRKLSMDGPSPRPPKISDEGSYPRNDVPSLYVLPPGKFAFHMSAQCIRIFRLGLMHNARQAMPSSR